MDDYTRPRRRIEPGKPPRRGGGGIPILPLVLVVVFAGLLLGGLLAKFMGSRSPLPEAASPAPSITPIAAAAPTPTLAPTATIPPSSEPSPSASPTTAATPTATPKPKAEPKPSPTQTAVAVATPTVRPSVIFLTPAPLPSATKSGEAKTAELPAPTETPAPIAPGGGSDRATSVVHSYIAALARGDDSSATSYLMTGLPSEKFIGPGAKITSINTTKNDDGSYKVTADIQTQSGEYFETFKVENGPNGMQISDHYAIKP